MEVCHNNAVRKDNHASNLRYDTPRNNRREMIKHGTCPFTGAKLKPTDVLVIRKLRDKDTPSKIAKKYSVKPDTICKIWRGDTWWHV